MNEICIGLVNGNYGKGLSSPTLRKSILRRPKEINDSGYKNENVFLFVGLFQANVGIDLISDILSNILKENIVNYTKYIYGILGLPELITNSKKKQVYLLSSQRNSF